MMNSVNKRITESPETLNEVPNNLPHNDDVSESQKNDSDYNISFRVSKKNLKKTLQILIVIIIIVFATPRIINNVKSTSEKINQGAEKFPVFFPSLSLTGSNIGSFVSNGVKNISGFVVENLANVAELFYSRKIENPAVDITPGVVEEIAKPNRLIIDKIGVNTVVLNPESTDLDVLDENLKYGAVRYSKSGLLGEKDNIYIFGHSTNWKTVRNQAYKSLNGLEKLSVGDTIKVQSENKEYLYRVTSVKKEKDSQAIVRFNTGKRTLTISTCNTLGAKEDRHIVEADFVISYPLTTGPENNNNNEGNSTENNNEENSGNNSGTTTLTPGQEENSTIMINNGNTIGNSDPYGQPDLVPEITEVGIIDPDTDDFVASSTPNASNKIAFKFIISNKGTKTAVGWRFNVVLPTNPTYIYSGKTQKDLRPGERIEYAMGFDRADTGKDLAIIVNVNPTGGTNESDKTNNIAKKLITILEND